MLTCRQVTERSTALLDGELSLRERMAMRMHLAMCVHCRRFNQQFRALMRSLPLRRAYDPVSDDFVFRILNAIGDAPHDDPGAGKATH